MFKMLRKTNFLIILNLVLLDVCMKVVDMNVGCLLSLLTNLGWLLTPINLSW